MNFLTSSTAPLSVRAASRAAWWSSESSRTTGTTRLQSCLKSEGPFDVHVKTNLKKLVTFSTGAWATSPTSPPPGSRLSLIILLLLSSAKKELNIHNEVLNYFSLREFPLVDMTSAQSIIIAHQQLSQCPSSGRNRNSLNCCTLPPPSCSSRNTAGH